jgi:hypothetical protein
MEFFLVGVGINADRERGNLAVKALIKCPVLNLDNGIGRE